MATYFLSAKGTVECCPVGQAVFHGQGQKMNNIPVIKAAIYTRKSSEEGLELEYNSLDAQRDACRAYIQSQEHEGWILLKKDIPAKMGSP